MPRILIVSDELVNRSMAGPAIRFYEFATQLAARGHAVTLTTPVPSDLPPQPFAVVAHTEDRLGGLAAEHDVVIVQGWTLAKFPVLAEAQACIVVDLYDPFPLEALVIFDRDPMDHQVANHARALQTLRAQLRCGDFFLCASETQRDYWLGTLTALDRVNPMVHAADPTVRSLIDVVPFGVSAEPPRRSGPGPRQQIGGIGDDDLLLLWGGGIYNWFDPLTLLEGLARAVDRHPRLRLLFMSTAHPNPVTPPMWMLEETRRRAEALRLLDTHVFFNETWVPYEERASWFLDADVGVSTNLDHLEAHFAFRTRILDYLWAGLPVICTAGDALAETITAGGMGISVPPGDPAAVAAAIDAMADDGRRRAMARRAAAYAADSTWPRVVRPLADYCAAPRRAADHALHREPAAEPAEETPGLRLRLERVEAERDRLATVLRAMPGSRLTAASLRARATAGRWLPPGSLRRRVTARALRPVRQLSAGIPAPAAGAAGEYAEWYRDHDAGAQELEQQRTASQPVVRFAILVDDGNDPQARALTLGSVEAQTWRHWSLGVTDAADYVIPLHAGDTLAPDCLYEVACEVWRDPMVTLVYWDSDVVGAGGGRGRPRFRPSWSPDMLLSSNYIGDTFAIRRRRLEAIGGTREELDTARWWDVVLRARLREDEVSRIPRVLAHTREPHVACGEPALRAVSEHLSLLSPGATASLDGSLVRPRFTPATWPHVTVVIPTRHNRPMIAACLDGLRRTDYPSFEVIVVDNGPRTDANEAWYGDTREGLDLRLLWWDQPFNYSAVNNAGARRARGELLVFLNDDTEVIDPSWMREIAGWAVRPGVGTVGLFLLGADDTVQHAGAVVGLNGFADHVFEGLPPDAQTMFGPVRSVRNALAVTGACMGVRRDLFEEIGGFDERFVLCGSDVVFGLGARLRGLRNVCSPFTPMRHLGSATRGTEVPRSDFLNSYWRYQQWIVGGDPYFSPNLSLVSREPALRRRDEPSAARLVEPVLGRRLETYSQAGEATHARGLARDFRATRRDITRLADRQAKSAEASAPRSVTWFLPGLDSPFYGGVHTALRIADHLLRHHGVDNRFALWGEGPEDFVRSAVSTAFPSLAGCPVTVHDGSPGSLRRIEASDAAVATFWATAYQVMHWGRSARSFYLIQDFEPMFYPAGTTYALAEETYRFGLHGICNTQTLRDMYVDEYGGTATAFSPAVDGSLFHSRGRAEREPDAPVTLFVYARPGHWRNCWEMASAALVEVKQRLGGRLRILTAGSWTAGGDRLERMSMRHLGLLDYHATGALYRSCDIGMALTVSRHPSYLPLEMMACGVPVIAFDNPAGHWLLRDGHNALLTERTADALAEAVERLVDDAPLRRALSTRAAGDVAARHADWDRALGGIYPFLTAPVPSASKVGTAGPVR